ncbi:MAG TPA: MarR family winged helix-turn-helix transcriptional regulator [Acidimicrobiales bacterium]|jgi:DNA-binding MarR family transcriptional regulator
MAPMAREMGHAVPLTADEEAFLRAFLRALVTVPRALDGDLMTSHGVSLTDYVGLMHLSEAPGHTLRIGDLANMCALSLSGTTRIVSRLEEQGLLRREQSASDARGWEAVLTGSGLAHLRRAWPSHLASVRRHIIDQLDDVDLPPITAAVSGFAGGSPQDGPQA